MKRMLRQTYLFKVEGVVHLMAMICQSGVRLRVWCVIRCVCMPHLSGVEHGQMDMVD